MGKRLTDKEKKEIIAYYVECQNYSETARKYDASVNTVKNIVKKDEESARKCKQKKEENTKTVLQAMQDNNDKKIKLLNKILDAIDGKIDNLDMFTNVKDLATAYGIIIDKELKVRELELKKKEIDKPKDESIRRIQIINDLPKEDENATSED